MRIVYVIASVLAVVITIGVALPTVPLWLLALMAVIAPPLVLFTLRRGAEPPNRSDSKATCERCSAEFGYFLIHNGFNDSAYAYCDACGMTALLSGWATNIPPNAGLRVHQPIAPALEEFLAPCSCGGRFRAHASPRCPNCREPLSAASLAKQIEKNAPGTKAGWRWQQNWSGLYAIVIENRIARDNWLPHSAETERPPAAGPH